MKGDGNRSETLRLIAEYRRQLNRSPSQAEIAAHLGHNGRGCAQVLLNQLEEAGYIYRVRHKGARRDDVWLTEEGQRLLMLIA